jgi:hypothetical protein
LSGFSQLFHHALHGALERHVRQHLGELAEVRPDLR